MRSAISSMRSAISS